MAFSPKRSSRVRATTPKGFRPAENNFHAIAQIHSTCLDASGHTVSSRTRSTTPTRKASEPTAPLMPCMYCGTLATRAHQAKCPRRPVVCVGCGQRDLTAASLVAHQQRACRASLVACPGCSESIGRGVVQKHIIRECHSRLFVCPDCGEGFNTPDEFVGHAYPRCKSGFVSCQLCNEPVSAALLAEHYALCAQKVLAFGQTQQEPKERDSSKQAKTFGSKSHAPQPNDLLSMHNRLLEKQVTDRARRSHSQTSQHVKCMDSGVQREARKGYMSATNASVTRCVFADLRSPPRGYIYINQPLTSRRTATPSRKVCEDKNEEGPQWASEAHTSSGTSGDVETTCESCEAKPEEQFNADNWLTPGQEGCSSDVERGVQDAQVEAVFSERVTLTHATNEEKKAGLSAHSEACSSQPHMRTVVGVSNRNWWADSIGERRVLKVNPLITERTPSPRRCESPNRSKRETTPQTTDGTINSCRPLSIPRVSAPLPSDNLINYNIHSKSPIRARARAASTLDLDSSTKLANSSSRILLQEALDKPLLPRAPPAAEPVNSQHTVAELHAKDDVPLSHSPQRERSAADAEIPTFSAIGCPPSARGGSIPRSLSPYHSYNSYSHRQKLHQQALLESNKSPVQSRLGVVGIYGLPIGLTSVSPLPSSSRGQHRLTRPLMQAQSEEELRADPRFARLTKAEKDAALRDIRLKIRSLKARAVVKERDEAGRAAAMMSPENLVQRSVLIMSPTTSSGALRRSVTPPARNHAGRPFKL